MKNITTAILFCSLTACDQMSMTNKPSSPQAPDHIQASQLQDYVTVQVQPTTKPERYMVYFGWPRIEDQKQVRIRKEQVLATVLPNQTTFSHEVDHNQTITYTFDITDSSARVEKSFSKQVIIPRDFVVRKEQSIFAENTKLNVNRVFLDSSTALVTNGFIIEITTNELHATDGIIETFPENSKALTDVDGRNGGSLTVSAKIATGTLKIFMRGENGGDGAKGDPFPNRAGKGSDAGMGNMDCSEMNRCVCMDRGADGGPGLPGVKGHKGHPGKRGGDSGILKISIQDGSAINIESNAVPGLAGAKGPGGDGQQGGPGGDGNRGSNPSPSDGCSGYAGSDGSSGSQGDIGDPGTDGNREQICLYIASEGKNDCY